MQSTFYKKIIMRDAKKDEYVFKLITTTNNLSWVLLF